MSLLRRLFGFQDTEVIRLLESIDDRLSWIDDWTHGTMNDVEDIIRIMIDGKDIHTK